MDDATMHAELRQNSQPAPPNGGRNSAAQNHLRLWPGVVLVAALGLARLWASTGEFIPQKFFFGLFIIPQVVLAGLLLWWLFASRLRWSDRVLVVGTLVAVTLITTFVADISFRGLALLVYALPVAASAWVGWLVLSMQLAWAVRRAGVLLIFVALGIGCSLLRIEGMDGSFVATFHWRWTPTPEDKLLADLKSKPAPASDLQAAAVLADSNLMEKLGDWPGFRGPHRDSRLLGVRIATDWQQSPPKELWRHRIGPGWSSFAVVGNRLFTQEQRGDDEYVVCYDATTGAEIWTQHDASRFTELVAGPGPRATPTFHDGRIYSFGAAGRLNCLSAADGKRLWTHDVAAETGATVPQWGFASSPLVAQGVVAVFAGAPNGKTLAAYRETSGESAWTANVGPTSEKPSLSYCSPQLETVDNIPQILLATDAGLSAFEPASGKELWHYAWMVPNVPRIVQPAKVGAGDFLIGTGMGNGTRRISVTRSGDDWQTKDQWTSRKIKPYYNDFVVYKDDLYGFDGNKFVCIHLTDGVEAWRSGGYGNGQVLLLADQGILLILSESGDVAVLSAQSEKREELCKFKALDGKTWNHPVIARGNLYVRNGEEIACFKLSLVDGAKGRTQTWNPTLWNPKLGNPTWQTANR